MAVYATKVQLERRLGHAVVASLFDENNTGGADNETVDDVLADASAKVDSYLAPLGVLPIAVPYPREIVRLTLDVASSYAVQRHPEATHLDWEKLMAQAEKDLDRLRMGKTMIGVTPPDPAANHGGEVYNNVVTQEDAETPSPWDDLGDF